MTAQVTIAAKQTPLSNAELEQALRQVLRLQLSLAIPALEKVLERQLSQSTPMPGEAFRQMLERQLPAAAPEREKALQQALFQRLSPVTPQLGEAFRQALEQHLASTVRRALTSSEPLAEDTARPSLKELLLRPGARTEQLTPLPESRRSVETHTP